jgi:hypothetical protein
MNDAWPMYASAEAKRVLVDAPVLTNNVKAFPTGRIALIGKIRKFWQGLCAAKNRVQGKQPATRKQEPFAVVSP